MHDDATTVQELVLAPEPASARTARRMLSGIVESAGYESRASDAALAVSEVVTNAVLHGREPITLRIHASATEIRVEVHDGSAVSPAFSVLDPTAVTGRGLVLVSAVADHWGVDPDDTGKTVWFTLDLEGPGLVEEVETERLLASWADTLEEDPALEVVRVVITDVKVGALAASEAHTEGLLRELALISGDQPDEGKAGALLRAAAPLDGMRLEIRRQATSAMLENVTIMDVSLSVRREDAEQVRDFMHALDEADRLSRQGELLLVPTPSETSAFRSAFLRRLLNQLRS